MGAVASPATRFECVPFLAQEQIVSQPRFAHRRTPPHVARAIAAFLAVSGISAGLAPAQPPAAAADKRPDAGSLLSDFIHYTRTNNTELAEAMGTELLDRNLSNSEFLGLVDASGDPARFVETAQRAMRIERLEPLAAAMLKSFETGKLERARDPEQIARNISLLTSTDRNRRIAEERLIFAGEYAMPQLLEAFLDGGNVPRQVAVRTVLTGLGHQAVVPLSAALRKVTPVQQEMIAQLLGQIPHRTSLPYLADTAKSTPVPAVRAACERAFDRIAGGQASMADVAGLYRTLAEAYYSERSDLTSFPGEEFQLLWDYDPGAGLVMTAIRTPVFHEAMTMSLAERALTLEGGSGAAQAETLALWIAANLSREIDTPPNYTNPAYPTSGDKARRSAEYFAVAAGPDVAQRVLARALRTNDTPLALKALSAVQRTAGSRSLIADGDGSSPLVLALAFPNRRVQYEAALALAAASPASPFSGSDRVVPILASAVKGAAAQTAVILASDPEAYQGVRAALAKIGYAVLPQARSLNELAGPIAEAPAVDLVVGVGTSADRIPGLIEEVRGTSKTSATPVFILTNPQAYTDVRRRFAGDRTIAIRQTGIGEAAINETVRQLVESASGGPIGQAEADSFASRALAALRDLAVSGNQVLSVGDAALPLIASLPASQGSVKRDVADILSRINQERAQRAVMDAALAASGSERIELLRLVSDSGKRFGNLLEPRQVAKLIELAGQGTDAEATAAASLIGALNLANSELVPLILKGR